jgi:shikimate kinase
MITPTCMNENRIVIIGFMGSGKTTVAQALANELDCSWVDLDALITKHEHRSPKEIIEQDGEAKFRERETWMLRKVLTTGAERVIAVGGGAWTIQESRKAIVNAGACAVWLDAPFELCWKRIVEADQRRPLAPSLEMARALYDERLPIYRTADLPIEVNENQTPEDIAQEIAAALLRWNTNS